MTAIAATVIVVLLVVVAMARLAELAAAGVTTARRYAGAHSGRRTPALG